MLSAATTPAQAVFQLSLGVASQNWLLVRCPSPHSAVGRPAGRPAPADRTHGFTTRQTTGPPSSVLAASAIANHRSSYSWASYSWTSPWPDTCAINPSLQLQLGQLQLDFSLARNLRDQQFIAPATAGSSYSWTLTPFSLA